MEKNIFLRFWIQNVPISSLSGIFPPKIIRNRRKKVLFKNISQCTIWPSGIKKAAKLTEILSAASQKNINSEGQSFRIKKLILLITVRILIKTDRGRGDRGRGGGEGSNNCQNDTYFMDGP